ncbi:MAG: NTP transferase domain-containing protein [Pyrodictiaceae archaeon]
MNIVIMAGGRAKRLGGIEKPLLRVCSKPMIKHILDEAAKMSNNIYVAVSPYTPLTRRWCLENNISIIMTSGRGYPLDIKVVLKKVEKPLLILPADVPFITVNVLKEFLSKALRLDKSIVTLIASRKCFPRELSKPEASPIGISLFKRDGTDWADTSMCKFPELLDIDTLTDLEYARRLCHEVSRWKFLG